MNLADKPFAHGLSRVPRIPYFVFVGVAVGVPILPDAADEQAQSAG